MLSYCSDCKQSMAHVVMRSSGKPLLMFLFTRFLSRSPIADTLAFRSANNATTSAETRSFPVDNASLDNMEALKVMSHRDCT